MDEVERLKRELGKKDIEINKLNNLLLSLEKANREAVDLYRQYVRQRKVFDLDRQSDQAKQLAHQSQLDEKDQTIRRLQRETRSSRWVIIGLAGVAAVLLVILFFLK
jgi:hypothetical protein